MDHSGDVVENDHYIPIRLPHYSMQFPLHISNACRIQNAFHYRHVRCWSIHLPSTAGDDNLICFTEF